MIRNIKTILIAIATLLLSWGNVNAYTIGSPPTMLPPAYSAYAPESAAADQGVTSTAYVTLKNLVDAIGATDKATIILTQTGATAQTTYTLTTNESVPKNQKLWFENGAIIDGAGTITLDNPGQIIAQPDQQIFGSSITVSFTYGGTVYVEWWGQNTTPDTTDMTAEIQAAMDSGAYRVKFLPTTYLTGTLTPPTQIHLQGTHQSRTILKLAANTDDHLFDLNTRQWVNISDLCLDGNKANNAATSNGIDMNACVSCSIERVYIKNFNDYGIYLDTCNDITLNRCWLYQNKYGFYSTSGEQCNLEKTVIEANETYGVQYVSALAGAVNIVNACWFENGAATPTDYIIVDSDNLHISANKFNVSGCSNSAVRFKTGALHNYIINNAMHQTDPTYFIVFDSGAKYNFSIANHGGSPITTDNDGENYILEYDSTGTRVEHKSREIHDVITFDADDATPSVKNGKIFKTANVNATTVTDFDDEEEGQEIKVYIDDDLTTYDFTASSLKGNIGVDWTPTTGDWLEAMCIGSSWYCSVHDCTS